MCYSEYDTLVYLNQGFTNCYLLPIDNVLEINSDNNISLYPNPTNNSITISTYETFSNNSPIQITITDNLGNTVFSNQFNNNNPNISLEACSNGIYFVKISQQGKTAINKKVVKY
jgi:hypothetical protein